MEIHIIDGTYELFRHFFAVPSTRDEQGHMEKGLIDAHLGGGVVKRRIGVPGRGKSGSARTLVATNRNERWFFVFGFEKNDRANIGPKELKALQAIAADLLKLSSA